MKRLYFCFLFITFWRYSYSQTRVVVTDIPKTIDHIQGVQPLDQLFFRKVSARSLSNVLSFDGGDGLTKSNFDLNVMQPSISLNFGDFLNKKETDFPRNILRGYAKVGFSNTIIELAKSFSKNVQGEAYFTYSRPLPSLCHLKYYLYDKEFNRQSVALAALGRKFNVTTDESERDELFHQFDSLTQHLRYNSQKYVWFSMTLNTKYSQEDIVEQVSDSVFNSSNELDYRVAVKFSYNFARIVNDNRGFSEFQWGGNQFIKPYINIGFTNRDITAAHKTFTETDTTGSEKTLVGIESAKFNKLNLLAIPGINFQMLGIKSKFGIITNLEVQNTFDLRSKRFVSVFTLDVGFNFSASAIFNKEANAGSRENIFIGFRYQKGLTPAEQSFKGIAPQLRFETPLDFLRKR